ncbi:MAG TPA: pyruvate dehydrogenase, partial [Acidimicrobiales bacterium]|nr:pyruvate dehydrogenase [Acidimicrobiales bacterium]
LGADDKVAVKPHASPVYHAIKYLTGEIDQSWLTRLRSFGGLQAYPSRTKDPDVFDFSTGSVGLGAVAPLFAAATRRYLSSHFELGPPGRFIALVGDAELDEGNVWEAIADPALQGLGNVMWVIDLNRQSLDRIVPELKVRRLQDFFAAAGWHVVEAKWGRPLEELFARPDGGALRRHLEAMSNEEYQSLVTAPVTEVRDRLSENADANVKLVTTDLTDVQLSATLRSLGGHDLEVLKRAYVSCDEHTEQPSVVFAYTLKGWGLPIEGDRLNHAALLTTAQVDALRAKSGLTLESEWDRFPSGSAEAEWCAFIGDRLNNQPVPPRPRLRAPLDLGIRPNRAVSTQESFGRTLTALAGHDLASRIVTVSPDVSISTNLGGWINRVGVYRPTDIKNWFEGQGLLRWNETPQGRHIELGISEMNLFSMLGQLGLAHEHHGEVLLPIGTVYDPFVCRGLDAFIYGAYNASRFIVVGTPSGVTLAPEGGAHQSAITSSIGIELPNVTFAEPAYAVTLEWLLCDGIDRLTAPDGESLYLRLSTRPIDQSPFMRLLEREVDQELRTAVLAGGYRLIENDALAAAGAPVVHLAASGAVMPEVVQAAEVLVSEGVAAHVLDITSADRLYRGWRREHGRAARDACVPNLERTHMATLIPLGQRRAPMVTITDAASHSLAWLGGCFGARTASIGVDEFGQSGSIAELYDHFALTSNDIVNAAFGVIQEDDGDERSR